MPDRAEPTTIRALLERIRDRETASWNFTSEPGVDKCPCYEDSRANIWDAVAALELLDNADREFFWVDAGRRLIHDPDPGGAS